MLKRFELRYSSFRFSNCPISGNNSVNWFELRLSPIKFDSWPTVGGRLRRSSWLRINTVRLTSCPISGGRLLSWGDVRRLERAGLTTAQFLVANQ